jgi:hypothetical protein
MQELLIAQYTKEYKSKRKRMNFTDTNFFLLTAMILILFNIFIESVYKKLSKISDFNIIFYEIIYSELFGLCVYFIDYLKR